MTFGTTMLELLRDQRGATAIEYGLIAALLVLGMMVGLSTFADSADAMFDRVSTATKDATEKAKGG